MLSSGRFTNRLSLDDLNSKLSAILLIENHPKINSNYQKWLEMLELHLIIAENLSHAFQQIHFLSPDQFELILLESTSPHFKKNNLGLNDANTSYANLPILIASSYMKTECNDIFHKLSPPAFLPWIKSWIHHRAKQSFIVKEELFI
jgi:response regulator RpfG family c-di-GMP phosphodiesterase